MNNRLVESDDGWTIALSNARVAAIHVDFRVGMDISDSTSTVRLIVETPCQLLCGEVENIVVPDDVATISPMLRSFNVGVEEIAIVQSGELTLRFSNGDRLNIKPSDDCEAWQIACADEFLIVCQPGGTVSVFQEPHSKS